MAHRFPGSPTAPSRRSMIVGVLLVLVVWPLCGAALGQSGLLDTGAEAGMYSITVETDNTVGDWLEAPVRLEISFPEILKQLGVDDRVDPRSIRLYQGDDEVPFRLSDELEATGVGTISWRKRIVGREQFVITFDLVSSGRAYQYPSRIPLIGDGDYLTYGERGLVRDFVGGLTVRVDVVDWYGDGKPYVLVSRHPGTHDGGVYLHAITGLTPEGVPVLDKGVRLPLREGLYVAADFRGDGAFDLLGFAVGNNTRTIYWYRNVGKPGQPEFRSPELLWAGGKVYDTGPEVAIRGLEVVDWDGDGRQDILVGTSEDRGSFGSIYFLPNTGTPDRPQFGAPQRLEAGGVPIQIEFGFVRPAAYDFRGAGVLDIVTGNRLNALYYIRNVGTRKAPKLLAPVKMVRAGRGPLELPSQQHYAVIRDLDGDDLADILLASDDPFLYFLRNTGTFHNGIPVFDDPRPVQQVDAPLSPGSLPVPTFVPGPRPDAPSIVAGNAGGYIICFKNTGSRLFPQFTPAEPLRAAGDTIRLQAGTGGSMQGPSEANWGYTAPLVVDWNGDGTLDVLTGSIFSTYRWFENRAVGGEFDLGEGQFLLSEHGLVFSAVHRIRPAAVDVNHDGLPEFLGLDTGGFLAMWERSSDGRRLGTKTRLRYETGEEIQLSPPLSAGPVTGRIKLAAGDWTGDGVWDLVLGTPMTHLNEYAPWRHAAVFVLENTGTWSDPVFKKPRLIRAGDGTDLHFGIHSAAPALADLDGDGHLDLVVGAENGKLYFYARAYLEGQTTARIVGIERSTR